MVRDKRRISASSEEFCFCFQCPLALFLGKYKDGVATRRRGPARDKCRPPERSVTAPPVRKKICLVKFRLGDQVYFFKTGPGKRAFAYPFYEIILERNFFLFGGQGCNRNRIADFNLVTIHESGTGFKNPIRRNVGPILREGRERGV